MCDELGFIYTCLVLPLMARCQSSVDDSSVEAVFDDTVMFVNVSSMRSDIFPHMSSHDTPQHSRPIAYTNIIYHVFLKVLRANDSYHEI